MALRGGATLAWQSDYSQFYLIDAEDPAFQVPTDLIPDTDGSCAVAPPSGLVVYTQDCLQQHIRIAIHDAEPEHPAAEPMGGEPWTQVQTIEVSIPSRRFVVSSPSAAGPLPGGPQFLLDSDTVMARISWKEFQGSRDDSVPVEPDVIDIALWPR